MLFPSVFTSLQCFHSILFSSFPTSHLTFHYSCSSFASLIPFPLPRPIHSSPPSFPFPSASSSISHSIPLPVMICLFTSFYLFLHPSTLFGPGTETFLTWTYLSCKTTTARVPPGRLCLQLKSVTGCLTAFL